MKFIQTFEELKSLPSSSKFIWFKNGFYKSCIVVGEIKQANGLIIVNNDNLKDFTYLRHEDFKENQIVRYEDYNSKEAGELMIQQLQEYVEEKKKFAEKEIESIKEVYLKEKV